MQSKSSSSFVSCTDPNKFLMASNQLNSTVSTRYFVIRFSRNPHLYNNSHIHMIRFDLTLQRKIIIIRMNFS